MSSNAFWCANHWKARLAENIVFEQVSRLAKLIDTQPRSYTFKCFTYYLFRPRNHRNRFNPNIARKRGRRAQAKWFRKTQTPNSLHERANTRTWKTFSRAALPLCTRTRRIIETHQSYPDANQNMVSKSQIQIQTTTCRKGSFEPLAILLYTGASHSTTHVYL